MEFRDPLPEEAGQLKALPQGVLPPEALTWEDEPHRVLVASAGARVVGAVNLAVVGPGEGWVEGVRLEPGQDPEVGGRLVQAAVAVLDGYGARVVRTALPASVRPAWLAAVGFVEAARFDVRWAPEQGRPAPLARRARPEEAGQLASRLREALEGAQGLIPLGWRWRTFSAQMAVAAAREGRLVTEGEGGTALFLPRGGDRLVAAVAGRAARLVAALAAEPQVRRVVCFLPSGSHQAGELAPWPAHGWCPEGVVVYELRGGGNRWDNRWPR